MKKKPRKLRVSKVRGSRGGNQVVEILPKFSQCVFQGTAKAYQNWIKANG